VYRGPHGGAIAFSTGALHEVMPHYALQALRFRSALYDARPREANNAILQEGDTKARDMLLPASPG
jgi:hypothetical protein